MRVDLWTQYIGQAVELIEVRNHGNGDHVRGAHDNPSAPNRSRRSLDH
jgi:hypothetical protein